MAVNKVILHPLLYSVIVVIIVISMSMRVQTLIDESCYLRKFKSVPKCLDYESYQPWPQDEECRSYHVQLAPQGTYKPTALVGFAHSGLDWFTHMIELGSGIATGSIVPVLANSSAESQMRCNRKLGDGRTLLQMTCDTTYNILPEWFRKTLSYDSKETSWPVLSRTHFNYHGVLLIRNPWHTLINARVDIQEHLRECAQCSRISRTLEGTRDYNEKDFTRYMENGATQWINLIETWVKGSPDISKLAIVQYENIIKNPKKELENVLKNLNVSIDEGRLDCLQKDYPIHYGILTEESKLNIANYFENRKDLKSRNILEEGIIEINQLFKSKGIKVYLDYKIPNRSDILFNKDVSTTRSRNERH